MFRATRTSSNDDMEKSPTSRHSWTQKIHLIIAEWGLEMVSIFFRRAALISAGLLLYITPAHYARAQSSTSEKAEGNFQASALKSEKEIIWAPASGIFLSKMSSLLADAAAPPSLSHMESVIGFSLSLHSSEGGNIYTSQSEEVNLYPKVQVVAHPKLWQLQIGFSGTNTIADDPSVCVQKNDLQIALAKLGWIPAEHQEIRPLDGIKNFSGFQDTYHNIATNNAKAMAFYRIAGNDEGATCLTRFSITYIGSPGERAFQF